APDREVWPHPGDPRVQHGREDRDDPRGERREAPRPHRARRAGGRADPLHAGDLHRPVLLRRAEPPLVRGRR
ncbi:MAG: hypothetical protein AVDCRST_MAG11-568, partial [uncultured Gemmatimonadaceae bacterium]